MNLQAILQGFAEYLEEQNTKNNRQYQIDTSNLAVSIFAHATEFKKYISEELNIFEDIKSLSVSEILSMEVENGQLVSPDEENQEEEIFKSNTLLDELNILNETSNEDIPQEITEEIPEELTETPEEELIEEPQEGLSEETSAQETLEQITEELPIEETSETEEELEEENETSEALQEENSNILIEIFNNILQSNEVISNFDADESGILDKEEILNFINLMNESDEDSENFSLNDLFFGIEEVKKDEEDLEADELEEGLNTDKTEEELQDEETEIESTTQTEEGSETDENEETKAKESNSTTDTDKNTESETNSNTNTNTNSSSNSSNVSYTGGNSSGGSARRSSASSSTTGRGSSNSNSLANMSKTELQSELSKANTQLQTQQSELSSVLDGSDSRIQAKNENVENLYSTYQEELKTVDVDMAQQVDTLKGDISAKETEVNTKEQEIVNQQITISNCETAYNNATATRQQLESSLASLNSADTSNMDESQIADLNAKKASLTQQIASAKEAENTAKANLETEKTKLEELNTQKQELQANLDELNLQMTDLEAQIAEKYPQVQASLDAYNQAKDEAETFKSGLVESAKAEVEKTQSRIGEINTALNNLANQETKKEYSLSPLNLYDEEKGEMLINTARRMLEQRGSTTGYCATGVHHTIKMAYGISMGGNGCDWDTNMEKLVEQGLFVEVTSEYPNASSLKEVKAGAVICWENTGVQDGSGGQYGHVTIADGQGGEISDHYQSLILSVGGRSDLYRVFIPV
ncbi:MAG: hypothetical protein IJB79_00795 [Candidatus Gastranaerophilales bacterium]|nr:hypothetical protein [bacterium]MBQ4645863.1 hypothetical protein [Candidatus Gastranaerophilales bacterium]